MLMIGGIFGFFKRKLCLISLYSYPLFNPNFKSPFGGSEVRSALIAKGLAKRKRFATSVLVFDHGQPATEELDGIKLIAWQGRACPAAIFPEEPAATGEPMSVDPPSIVAEAVTEEECVLVNPSSGILHPMDSDVPVTFCHSQRLRFERWVLSLPSWPRLIFWRLEQGILALKYWMDAKKNERKRAREWRARFIGKIGPESIERSAVAIYDYIDADIFMAHGNTRVAAELALFCKIRKKKFVFLASSDGDYHPDYKSYPDKLGVYGQPGYLMNYTIQNASRHIVQNERQAIASGAIPHTRLWC